MTAPCSVLVIHRQLRREVSNHVIVHPRQMADHLCKRKIAETRRNGWRLRYAVAGHTTQALTAC